MISPGQASRLPLFFQELVRRSRWGDRDRPRNYRMPRANPASPPRPAVKDVNNLRITRALLAWFREHRRPLPWRASSDAYRVWISEVMLQQTQVATVIPYYQRFLKAFPTLRHLARAPLERVLQLWSGLGYYRRARQLHEASQIIVARFGGCFPATLEEALQLPGVGGYTAAAVLSIAYGVPLAALDGNVARVVSRLEALPGSLAQPAFRKGIEAKLAALLPKRQSAGSAGDFNQALMELGQTICLPRAPRCPVCPMRKACRGRLSGNPEAFPSPRPRRATEESHLAAALILRPVGVRRNSNPGSESGVPAMLMARGLDDGLMPDLWNFPSAFGASIADARQRLETKLADLTGGPASLNLEVARVRHNVTYRQIDVRVYRASLSSLPRNGFRWLAAADLGRAAVSQLARKIAEASASALN